MASMKLTSYIDPDFGFTGIYCAPISASLTELNVQFVHVWDLDVFVFLFLKGMGIVSLVVSLVIRLITTYLGLLGNDLNLKERLFIAIAWLPKATVQVSLIAKSFRRLLNPLSFFNICSHCCLLLASEVQ